MRKMMTTAELANYLRLHETTIWKHASGGRIPTIRVGRLWRFDKETIDKWIEAGGRTTPRIKNKAKAKSSSQSQRKKPRMKQKTRRR